MIYNSFMRFITPDEKESIESFKSDQSNNEKIKEDLIDTLDSYKTFSNPTKEKLDRLLKELGHQEIIQKPRYMANCFQAVLTKRVSNGHPFHSSFFIMIVDQRIERLLNVFSRALK